MSYNATLRADIAASIKTPADPKISGAILQQQLLAMVGAMEEGAVFAGTASPATSPTGEANRFYLATEQGTYTNFIDISGSAITLSSGEVAFLSTIYQGNNLRFVKTSIPQPHIDPTTGNWFVGNVDTGVKAQGPQGETGPANSLSIGTVQSGVNAGANISGAAPNQVLNLVLPKGEKGDTGNPGHNPNLGTYDIADLSNAPTPTEDGDYIVVIDANAVSPRLPKEIYLWDGDSWEPTGEAPTATFASGEVVSNVSIINEPTIGGEHNVASAEAIKQLNGNVYGFLIPQSGDTGYGIQTNVQVGNTIDITPVSVQNSPNIKHYIQPCSQGEKIIVNGVGLSTYRLWCFCTSEHVVISASKNSAIGNNLELSVPENAAYVIINDSTGIGNNYYIKKDSFVFLEERIGSLEKKSDDVYKIFANHNTSADNCTFFARSTNLYDKNAAGCKDNCFINHLTGVENYNDTLKASDYIRVTPGKYYITNYEGQAAFYRVDKSFISGMVSFSSAHQAPADAYYVRCSFKTENDDVNRLNESNTLLAYEDFWQRIPEKNIEISVPKFKDSANLFDESKSTSNKYAAIDGNGNLRYYNSTTVDTLRCSDFIPVTAGAVYYGMSTASYVMLNAEKQPIADGYQTWACKTISQAWNNGLTIPSGVSYIIVNFYMNNDGHNVFTKSKLMPYVEPNKILDVPYFSLDKGRQCVSKLGNGGVTKTATTLADTESIVIDNFPRFINRGDSVSFMAKITSFGALTVGKGKTYTGSVWIEIDSNYVKVTKSNDNSGTSTTELSNELHNLTISTYIKVLLKRELDELIVVVETLGGCYQNRIEAGVDAALNGDAFVTSDGTTLTDCKLCVTNSYLKSSLWAFGDSYYGMKTSDREMHWLNEWGCTNYLIDNLGGISSPNSYKDLIKCIDLGCPQYLIWSLGMNDDNTEELLDITATNWYKYYTLVEGLCEERGIELILTTIPKVISAAVHNKDLISTFIRQSGHRYIDAAEAVGSDEYGHWYGYGENYDYQSTDNVHPSEYGARAIATQFLVDAPEIMQY